MTFFAAAAADVSENVNDYSGVPGEEKVNDSSTAADVSENVNDYSGVPGGEVNDTSDTEEEILGGIENSDEE
jgi:hypothetical protein